MRALVFEGPQQVALDFRHKKPLITQSQDATIRVHQASIDGTDLQLFAGCVPDVEPGDVLGHEAVGVIEAVG